MTSEFLRGIVRAVSSIPGVAAPFNLLLESVDGRGTNLTSDQQYWHQLTDRCNHVLDGLYECTRVTQGEGMHAIVDSVAGKVKNILVRATLARPHRFNKVLLAGESLGDDIRKLSLELDSICISFLTTAAMEIYRTLEEQNIAHARELSENAEQLSGVREQLLGVEERLGGVEQQLSEVKAIVLDMKESLQKKLREVLPDSQGFTVIQSSLKGLEGLEDLLNPRDGDSHAVPNDVQGSKAPIRAATDSSVWGASGTLASSKSDSGNVLQKVGRLPDRSIAEASEELEMGIAPEKQNVGKACGSDEENVAKTAAGTMQYSPQQGTTTQALQPHDELQTGRERERSEVGADMPEEYSLVGNDLSGRPPEKTRNNSSLNQILNTSTFNKAATPVNSAGGVLPPLVAPESKDAAQTVNIPTSSTNVILAVSPLDLTFEGNSIAKGTLYGLVCFMTESAPDTVSASDLRIMRDVFCSTYKAYSTSDDVLRALLASWERVCGDRVQIRIRVRNEISMFVEYWLGQLWVEPDDERFLQDLLHFVRETRELHQRFPKLASHISQTLKVAKAGYNDSTARSADCGGNRRPAPSDFDADGAFSEVFGFSRKAAASQLTILANRSYKKINFGDILACLRRRGKIHKWPNTVTGFMDLFHLTVGWVVTHVSSQKNEKGMTNACIWFLDVAKHCWSMSNFLSTMAISHALLEHCHFGHAPPNSGDQTTFCQRIASLIDPSQDEFFAYQEKFRTRQSRPCMPLLTIHIRQLSRTLRDIVDNDEPADDDPNISSVRRPVSFQRYAGLALELKELLSYGSEDSAGEGWKLKENTRLQELLHKQLQWSANILVCDVGYLRAGCKGC